MTDQKAINQQLKRLQEEIENDNDEQILKISQGLLEKVPTDEEVLVCNIISHLKLSKFDSISLFSKTFKPSSNEDLNFGYAYFLYKKGRFDECSNFIKEAEKQSDYTKRALLLLSAQTKYKTGSYLEAAKIYINVIQNSPNEQDTAEILCNLLNAISFLSAGENAVLDESLRIAAEYAVKNENDIPSEFYFNLALIYTSVGNLGYAKSYLSKFKQSLDDEGDKTDLLRYDIQMDYINSTAIEYTHEENEAKLKEYCDRIEWDVDNYYKAALKNNLIHFRDRSKELSDSIKKLDEVIKFVENNSDFTKTQVLEFKVNKLILYLGKNKYTESSKLIDDIEKTHSFEECVRSERFLSSKFYLLVRMKKYKEIDTLHQSLLERIQNFPSGSQLPVLLLNAEINKLFGNQKALIENLKRIIGLDKSFVNNATLCCILVNVIASNIALMPEFKDVIEFIERESKSIDVYGALADLYLKIKAYDKSTALFEKVLLNDSKNVKALEKLSFLYSFNDWKKAESYLAQLPSIDIITDANELRRLELDYLPIKNSKNEEKIAVEGIIKKTKKIRKRKPRYPKGFDPSKPGEGPDPERWLPKLERTKYRKIAKQKGLLLRGTQGAAAGKESVQTFQKGPSTANTEVAVGGSASKNKKNKKKK